MTVYDFSEFFKFVKRMLVENSILVITGIIVLLCFGMAGAILGWLWGNLGNLSYFLFLHYKLSKLSMMEDKKREIFIRKIIGRRFAFICIMIFIAVVVPQIHLLAATIGFISFKLLIYIDQFVVKPYILPRLNKTNL